MAEDKEPPSAKAISDEGYNQTYIIMSRSTDSESKLYADAHEVFFRCGNWCYKGFIQFGGLSLTIADLPTLIPALQRQQGSLRYYCNAKSLPPASDFFDPVSFLHSAIDFLSAELISDRIERELKKMSSVFPWIAEDSAATYFELTLTDVPDYLSKVGLVASKTYTRGLILITVYHESSIYFVVQSGEGDQALLDVRFPDVSSHGQGLLLNCYNNSDEPYRSLTIWHSIPASTVVDPKPLPKLKTLSITTKEYQQTYCIMNSTWDKNSPALSVHHDVLFRFGSWCYAGRVQLTPSLTLADIPFVIPALRMQQSRLDFVFDTNNIPITSPFAPCLEYVFRLAPLIEQEIANSEESLQSLIDRLSKMGLGDSIARWLEGNEGNSFFEFKLAPDAEMTRSLNNMELVACKSYHPSGIVTVTILFQNTIYVSIGDASQENPLLDSRFPDVSGKGRGYQVQAYPQGADAWPALRKVSVWQTVSALEQEFRDRAALVQKGKEIDSNSIAGAKEDSIVVNSGRDAPEDNFDDGAVDIGGSSSSNSNNISSAIQTTPMKAEDKNQDRERDTINSASKSGFPRSQKLDNDDVSMVSTSSSMAIISAAAGGKDDGTIVSSPGGDDGSGLGPLRPRIARPHHVPKLDSLSKRLDEIRKTMGDQTGLSAAPWDSKGRPLGAIGESFDRK